MKSHLLKCSTSEIILLATCHRRTKRKSTPAFLPLLHLLELLEQRFDVRRDVRAESRDRAAHVRLDVRAHDVLNLAGAHGPLAEDCGGYSRASCSTAHCFVVQFQKMYHFQFIPLSRLHWQTIRNDSLMSRWTSIHGRTGTPKDSLERFGLGPS